MKAKPKPPADLWERLDGALNELGEGKRPKDSFTMNQFRERFGFSETGARRRMEKLINAGVVERGGSPHNGYYLWKDKP